MNAPVRSSLRFLFPSHLIERTVQERPDTPTDIPAPGRDDVGEPPRDLRLAWPSRP